MTPERVASTFHTLQEGDLELFNRMAATAEAFQRKHNPVYAAFEGYRYLPVEAFKRTAVCTFDPAQAEAVFASSGTSGVRSRHYVRDLDLYRRALTGGFERRFQSGPYVILAHLPGYAQDSSLVYMLRTIIERYGAPGSGFFLDDLERFESAIQASRESGVPLLLFGVAFGLLDLLDHVSGSMPKGAVIVETGGMKTHSRSITRSELHGSLRDGFGAEVVTSEYGMCELMSQCWMDEEEWFLPPPWMRIDVLDPLDPVRSCAEGEPGALAVFDLANLYSVSAILTQDRAVRSGQRFQLLGRLSGAELRGCNFLLEDG